MLNVLFLCTGNSARSLLAEAYLNACGGDRFRAFSAGSFPTGTPNPYALKTLRGAGFSVEGLRSKSWDEFACADAPKMDIIITVCDNAAGEVCPIWPGRPTSAHWPFPDPAAHKGPEAATLAHFSEVFAHIRARIDALVNLCDAELAGESGVLAIRAIGDLPLDAPQISQ
ncbi:MAG: arsenate reductase ArsC [Parvibaculum sp.]